MLLSLLQLAAASWLKSQKMDALSVDRAKSDFISSVSHELRSPSMEFLQIPQ
jgi:signal transduction histidine kinase